MAKGGWLRCDILCANIISMFLSFSAAQRDGLCSMKTLVPAISQLLNYAANGLISIGGDVH